MKLYVGVNSDGSEIISKQKLKRYIDYKTNENDVLSFEDTRQPPHWMLDYTGIKVAWKGEIPVNKYLTLPSGSIYRMFGISLTWDDEAREVDI